MERSISILVLLVCLYNMAEGARRVDANLRARETMSRRRRDLPFPRSTEENAGLTTDELFQLTKGESVTVVRQAKNVLGMKVDRLQEKYNGIPVYDAVVTARTDRDGTLTGDASGTLIQGIDGDLPDTVPVISDEECLEIAVRMEGDEGDDRIGDISYKQFVYLDKHDTARLVNLVTYLIDSVKRPHYIIDLKTKEVLTHWDGLDTFNCGERTYKAYGGNEKQGKIKYGDLPYCLNLTVDGDTCYLENQYVRVVDMNYSMDESIAETASFKCKNGYDDEVNDAYSPAIDGFFYGTIVGKMFEDWFDGPPLDDKIVIRVHYGRLYENAFWNGVNTTFGDGGSYMYPFTTLDVVGHEIGHGVTEQGSGLMYFDESGGVNEAFSDMLGEASEQYLESTDLVTGRYVMKTLPFMRSFEDPESDNSSITYAYNMTPSLDPHYSSGVFRRVFYVVTKQKDVPIRYATKVFLHANRMYWHHYGTFFDCACGVLKAAIDLGYSVSPYRRAFEDVGIADCDVTDHVYHLANNITQPDVSVSDSSNPMFKFQSPPWAESIYVSATSESGAAINIRLQNGTFDETEDGTPIDLLVEGESMVQVSDIADSDVFIILSSESSATETVSVTAGYVCMDSFSGGWQDSGFYEWYCNRG